VKAKRRANVAKAARTPTVRRIKPAIASLGPRPAGPSMSPSTGSAAARRPVVESAPEAPVPGLAVDALGGRPVDLAVDLADGLVLTTPVIAAAGPFGYGVEVADLVDLARLGGLVTRGTSLKPRAGHAAPRMVEVPAGLLVGTGPQNPGLDLVLDRYASTWAGWPVPVILNLCGDSASDYGEAARRLEGVPGLAGVEVNLSCSSGRRGNAFGLDAGSAANVVGAVRRACDLPLVAKLTPAATDVRSIARAVVDAGADAVSAVNTLPGFALAPDRRGPALGSEYGGVCGPALRPVALRVVWEVAQAVDVPVIGIGGIATLDDMLDMLAAGASAVGIGVAALADPMLPVRLADELADACRARGLASARDLVGTAVPARPSPPSTRGAEYAR
jgi:dihydroorotate dehydrogenase (NAD+) catalytic subunit